MDTATEWCLTQRLMGKMIELQASCKESRVCGVCVRVCVCVCVCVCVVGGGWWVGVCVHVRAVGV